MLMRFKSADDGISTAVVLCLQSGKARGQTPQQRGAYLLRRRCKDDWIRLLAVDRVGCCVIIVGLAVRCPREEARRILISSSGTHSGRSLVAAA